MPSTRPKKQSSKATKTGRLLAKVILAFINNQPHSSSVYVTCVGLQIDGDHISQVTTLFYHEKPALNNLGKPVFPIKRSQNKTKFCYSSKKATPVLSNLIP